MRRTISALLRAHLALLLAIFGLSAVAHARAQIAVIGDGGPGPVKAQHLTAELVALGPAIAPGGTQTVGLVLTLEEKWHVYWINPGDSGEPPRIAWTLPAGLSAGSMQFPIPEQLPLGPLMDYGYEDEVAFPITISAAPTLKPGPLHLDAQVSWLVCAQLCVPGKAHLGIDLTLQPGAPQPSQEPLVGALGEAMALVPKPLPAGTKFSILGGAHQFAMALIDGHTQTNAEFYPYPTVATANGDPPPSAIAYTANQKIEPQRDGVRLYVPRSPDLATLPATLHGVFKLSDTEAYDVNAPVVPGEIAPATPKTGSTTVLPAIGAIGLAFLGGVILNLMPCVFPVLFLKGLALVQTAGAGGAQQRSSLRQHGLLYTLGILLSFWTIVAVLLLLRASGSHAGWGFQLQSPVFIAMLASLLFLLALSLAGQFDIGLSLTSVGSSLLDQPEARSQSYAGSFFTGVLATVVATPCTAPLMGAAVGFALTQSAAISFAVFTALALGLAAPYLLLSWHPAWVRVLPRPGAWMELLKQFTAIPLFATAIWLVWVYGQLFATSGIASTGINQIALLLACFLLLAIAGWALGRWPAQWPSRIAALVLIALGLAIPLSQTQSATRADASAHPEVAQPNAAQTNTASAESAPIMWQPYSEQALDAARAAGHPVFIDFTAAWCLSCQFNERAVLQSAEVESALRTHNVTLLKADWTNSDLAITQKLASVGRAGVPTYVLYPAATDTAPDVLPELLTKSLVLAAIARDTNS
jgi:thiol:disulfide interchange protein DsbD